MAARIVHFGTDDAYRCFVLACDGYAVSPCGTSVPKLYRELKKHQVDSVTLGGDGLRFARRVRSISHCNSVPLVLFAGNTRHYDDSTFDLVIRPGTPSAEWLARVSELVQKSRSIRQEAKHIREQSAELRRESVRVRYQAISAGAIRQSLTQVLELRLKISNLQFALQHVSASDKQKSALLLALTEANKKLADLLRSK